MSDSDSDAPLVARSNGVKSKETVSKNEDRNTGRFSNGSVEPGVSLRMGPVREESMNVDKPVINGINGKRKSRVNGASYREASSSGDDEDAPLNKKRKTSIKPKKEDSDSDEPLAAKPNLKIKKPPKASPAQIGESDDDVPLTKKLSSQKAKIEKQAEVEAKKLRNEDNKKQKAKASRKTSSSSKVKQEESDEDDKPLKRKATSKAAPSKASPAKATPASNKGKGKAKEVKKEEIEEGAEDEEDEEYHWWEQHNALGDGTKKWSNLEHNGVVFPPPYEPLPSNVRLHYDGTPVNLNLEAEEVATFYGSMLHSKPNVENPTFNKNFFEDFTAVLNKTGHATDKHGNKVKIVSFEKCNFRPIFEYFDAGREAKKNRPAAEKKAEKAEKEEREGAFQYCQWDGRKQKVGNFRIEPPGLFRGRGEHPKTGRIKKRVLPEQITINIGEKAQVPAPPEGHRWKEIKHDHEGTWLAMWQENINNAYKYVMLAANSDIKGQSDFKKFEKARELKKYIDKIRIDYRKGLKDPQMADRQRATAMYLIDEFALRAGNEKGEDEADTVGCCSLKYEHITLQPPNIVVFDFLGKDSIRYHEEVKVDEQVFKNLRIFKKEPKGPGDEVFDRLTTSSLNKHLATYMPGLTAKVFRTYNASFTMSKLLRDLKVSGTIPEKVKDYNDANRRVAILCNHKRTVAAGHQGAMEKLDDKINGLRYQQWRIKQMILDVDPKSKSKLNKKHGEGYFDLPKDLTPEWVQKHVDDLVQEQRTKIEKKFAKENNKLKEEGKKEMKHKELDERLQVAKDLEKKLKAEAKKRKVDAEGKGPTVEKYDEQIKKLDQRIETMRVQADDKENTKEVALGTSKINYIDPRLTVVFSKKFDVPIERFFSKSLREKFDWAIKSVDENWEF
ncbi:MAG: hypothetical protein Q9159_000582 [Coniocarpon cinnabarinum]